MRPSGFPRPFAQLELCTPRLVWVYRDALDPAYRAAPQAISEEELACWLILRGGLHLTHEGRSTDARPGDVILLSSASFDARWEATTRLISVRCRWPASRALRFFDLRGPLIFPSRRVPALGRATQALGQWAARHCPGGRADLRSRPLAPADWLRLNALHATWLAALHDTLADHGCLAVPPGELDARVVRALELIRDHPLLSERALAAEVGISLSHLQRLFRDQLERSIHRIADEARLQRARALVAAPDAFMKGIAAQVGFRSAQTFARWFRQRTGCSPTDYQARVRRLV